MSIKNTNNEAFWLRSLERFANGAFRFCFEMNLDLFFSQRYSCGAPSRPIRAKKRRRRPTDSPAPATVAVIPGNNIDTITNRFDDAVTLDSDDVFNVQAQVGVLAEA